MPKRTTDYRDTLLDDLLDPSEAAQYLTEALHDSEEMFLLALRDVAEAHQMAKVAGKVGVSRESLYRMLVASGNPTYHNLFGVLRALGVTFGDVRPRTESTGTPHGPATHSHKRRSTRRRRKGRLLFCSGLTTPDKAPKTTPLSLDPQLSNVTRAFAALAEPERTSVLRSARWHLWSAGTNTAQSITTSNVFMGKRPRESDWIDPFGRLAANSQTTGSTRSFTNS